MCHVGDILYHSKFLYVPSTHDTMLSRWEMENQHNRNRVVCRDAVRWNGFSFFQAENEKDCLSQCNVCVIGNCLFSLWHLAVQLFCGLCIDCHIRRYLIVGIHSLVYHYPANGSPIQYTGTCILFVS